MERIKDIKEIIIGEGEVLFEVIHPKRKSGIILEEKLSDKRTNDYGIIIAKGSAVVDLEVGDIVVRIRPKDLPGYEYHNKEYVLTSRYNIAIVVKPANFSLTEELRA